MAISILESYYTQLVLNINLLYNPTAHLKMYLESIHFWLYITVYLIKKQDISERKIQGNYEPGRRGEGGDIHVFVLTKTKIKWKHSKW